jgi:hypothetical protein
VSRSASDGVHSMVTRGTSDGVHSMVTRGASDGVHSMVTRGASDGVHSMVTRGASVGQRWDEDIGGFYRLRCLSKKELGGCSGEGVCQIV